MKRTLALAAAASCPLRVVAGCCSTPRPPAAQPASATPPRARAARSTVFAAASLKATFTDPRQAVRELHNPGTTVKFSFAGSSDLVTQLTQGAPADVFASADTKNMTKAVDGGVVTAKPVNFASNTLTIVTSAGKPERYCVLCRSGQAGYNGRGVRTPGAVRIGDAEGREGHRCDPDAGQ